MANRLAHCSFFILFSMFAFTNAMKNGFSLDLIHRDSPNSPFYDPSLSITERMSKSFHRSFHRSKQLCSNSSISLESSNGEYLMKFSIGTPPVHTFGIADTGSDLTWTQCLPCEHCFKQRTRLFNPRKSSSYKPLSCNSKMCHAPSSSFCNRTTKTCSYEVSYGDQSHSYGDLATETLRFGKSKQLSLKNTVIGCGHDNAGTFSGGNESGIIGLGGGKFSLISQMKGKFSYCLALPYSQQNSASRIHFGHNAVFSGKNVVTTPLTVKNPATFYFLTIEGISVGKKRLNFQKFSLSVRDGNIIIDSGTVLTFFEPEIYSNLEAMVKGEIKQPTVADPTGALSLCYKSLSLAKIPIITVHFTGADVKLKPVNTFVETSDSSLCFAFAASNGVPIYGNIAQTNFLVGYDLKKKIVSFEATDCSKHY